MPQPASKRLVTEESGATLFTPIARPTNISTGARVYDRLTNLYGVEPTHLRKFRGKLAAAAAGTGMCEVACIGDSIVAGQGATVHTQSWPVVARKRMVAATGVDNSTGWCPPYLRNGAALVDTRWTIGSGWTQAGTYLHCARANTSGAVLTFTSDSPGTAIDLLYSDNSGPFTVAIDGGSAVTVTPTNGNQVSTYTVTGLTGAVHTIVVTTTSTTETFIYGARVRYSKGLSVSNWGYSNSQASNWNTTSWWLLPNYVRATNPDLVLIGLGTNEAGNAVTPATYSTNMSALIDKFITTANVMLLTPIPLGSTDLAPYRQALYSLAATKGVPVLDLFDRWVNADAADALGMYSDAKIHPSATGYADIGLAVARVLGA